MKVRTLRVQKNAGATTNKLEPLAGERMRLVGYYCDFAISASGDTVLLSWRRGQAGLEVICNTESGPAGASTVAAAGFIGAPPQTPHLVSTVVATGVANYTGPSLTVALALPDIWFGWTMFVTPGTSGGTVSNQVLLIEVESTVAAQGPRRLRD